MVKSKAFALEVIRSCQVLREARCESALINWLEILIESGYYSDRTILDKCIEIKRILISSLNTAKENNHA